MIEFLYWFYFGIATIVFFVEFTKDKNFFIVLIGFLFGGVFLLIIPVLPILLIKLIPDDYLIVREIIGGIYILILITLCFKYFIAGYLSSTKGRDIASAKSQEKVEEQKNESNHDRFKPQPSAFKSTGEGVKFALTSESKLVHQSEKKHKAQKETAKTNQVTNRPQRQDAGKEETKSLPDIKYVNYNLQLSESEKDFPILKIPNQNCVVRSYRFGATKRRGHKEVSFQQAIEYFFSNEFEISGNTRLNTGKNTRPFEPDIAMISKNKENIRIDIEIDEPYAGITRQPTHCLGDDTNRDNYFKDRGWIVIRFSEYQVHTHEKECLKYIADLIANIKSNYKIPNELKSITQLSKEKVWDIIQAQKWEKLKYRESYLNHEFKILEEQQETLNRDFDEQEILEEKYVVSTSFGKVERGRNIAFNRLNKNPRDNRIKFYSEKHIYTIDGVPAYSTTNIINRFFPEFDMKYWAERKAPKLGMTPKEVAKMWEEKGKTARNKGILLHEQIENYYLGIDYVETDEFEQFREFVSDHEDLEPYRSEWRIFDENMNIAGTVDLIVANGVNHDIYDWKRSKKVVNIFDGQPINKNQWQQGVGGLKHIDDTSYNRYCLQQSLYKYILEKNYGITIENMYLIIMHSENAKYYKLKVPYFEKEIKYILKTV